MTNLDLFKQYQETKDIETRNQLVEQNMYMIDVLARKFLGKGVDYDDLYQVGAVALVAAVERFDPERGFEFSSFAIPTILGEIKKYFRDKQWALKVPRRTKELALRISKTKELLYGELGRTPTLDEVAKALDCSQEDLLEAMEGNKVYGTYSLSGMTNDSGEEDSSLVEKFTAREEQGFSRLEIKEVIDTTLSKMSDIERTVFRRRFIDGITQSKIAEEIGISQMTVSRAEKSIKEKFLREYQR